MFFCICGAPNLEPLLRGLYCCDALLSLQKAGLLPGAPSRDFLKGVKAKKTSYVEVLIARRRLRDYLLDLVPDGEQQTMRDLFLLVSKSLTAFPLEGVPLTAPSLVLAEMLRDLHNGSFDPTLRTFLSEYPGGLEESFFLFGLILVLHHGRARKSSEHRQRAQTCSYKCHFSSSFCNAGQAQSMRC